jgi:hypothetical protein
VVAGHEVANLTAYRIAFLIAAAICLCGVAWSLSVEREFSVAMTAAVRISPLIVLGSAVWVVLVRRFARVLA